MAEGSQESAGSEKDALLQRHKQELKDLRAKIQYMKKAVPKGDKKRKKEVTAETARLEQELQEKHEQELKSVETNGESVRAGSTERLGEWGAGRREDEEGWKTVSDEDKPIKKSRAQRRKVCQFLPLPSPILSLSPSLRRKRHSRSLRGCGRGRRRRERWLRWTTLG